jgi:hypothetical protein
MYREQLFEWCIKIFGVESSKVPDEFTLLISPHNRPHECQVTRRSKDGLGVEFTGNDRGMNESELHVGDERPKKARGFRGGPTACDRNCSKQWDRRDCSLI